MREPQCEAYYYVGMKHLLMDEQDAAGEMFRKCLATNWDDFDEYVLADSELRRMNHRPESGAN